MWLLVFLLEAEVLVGALRRPCQSWKVCFGFARAAGRLLDQTLAALARHQLIPG